MRCATWQRAPRCPTYTCQRGQRGGRRRESAGRGGEQIGGGLGTHFKPALALALPDSPTTTGWRRGQRRIPTNKQTGPEIDSLCFPPPRRTPFPSLPSLPPPRPRSLWLHSFGPFTSLPRATFLPPPLPVFPSPPVTSHSTPIHHRSECPPCQPRSPRSRRTQRTRTAKRPCSSSAWSLTCSTGSYPTK